VRKLEWIIPEAHRRSRTTGARQRRADARTGLRRWRPYGTSMARCRDRFCTSIRTGRARRA